MPQTRSLHPDGGKFTNYGTLPYSELISYDVENIDAVLILNFFKYLDAFIAQNDPHAVTFAFNIYQHIENLSEEELSKFLKEIGMKISDTMEYNFFGAHQIDFDTLIAIRDKQSGYSLKLSDLISELREGNL